MQFNLPPKDWKDIKGWDNYFIGHKNLQSFGVPTAIGSTGWQSVRFLNIVKQKGDRIWFPGCGVDIGPRFYASIGCNVLATDFSPVAVKRQRSYGCVPRERLFSDWSSFARQSDPPVKAAGMFDVVEQDFTKGKPEGVFDVVLNCRAFQGLSASAMSTAARNFFAALRPGGAVVIDTMNVQGKQRNVIEDSLIEAGFFIPFTASARWYRSRLDDTGITYNMVLDRPRVCVTSEGKARPSTEQLMRDQVILDSFDEEYKIRIAEEREAQEELARRPETITAYVVYPTG